ncbi:MAG: DUF488 domain-containing protein [Sphingomonadaceae bacterium]
MGNLAIKRVYAPPAESDGKRILVDRLWPRGLSRSEAAIDDWIMEIAPSAALRKWFGHDPARFAQFGNRYRDELDGNPAPVERLCGTLQDQDVTLVYAARDERHNHARVLRDYLARRGCTVRKGA